MEFKLRKCFFLRKFNDKKIISLGPVEQHIRYSLNWSRMSFDRQKIFSQCGRCALNTVIIFANKIRIIYAYVCLKVKSANVQNQTLLVRVNPRLNKNCYRLMMSENGKETKSPATPLIQQGLQQYSITRRMLLLEHPGVFKLLSM